MSEKERNLYLFASQPSSFHDDCAIDIYIKRIGTLYPIYPDSSHAQLRIAADPMFCMGYCEADEVGTNWRMSVCKSL